MTRRWVENDWNHTMGWMDTFATQTHGQYKGCLAGPTLVPSSVSPVAPSQGLECSSGSLGFAPKVEFSECLKNHKLQKPSHKGKRESQQPDLALECHSPRAGHQCGLLAEPESSWTIITWASLRILIQPFSPWVKRERQREERREGGKGGGKKKMAIVLSLQDGIWNNVEFQNKYWTTCKLNFPGTSSWLFGVCLL